MKIPFFSHSFHLDEIKRLAREKCKGNFKLSEDNSYILETVTPVTCGSLLKEAVVLLELLVLLPVSHITVKHLSLQESIKGQISVYHRPEGQFMLCVCFPNDGSSEY